MHQIRKTAASVAAHYKLLLTIILLTTVTTVTTYAEVCIDGSFQGKSLYIQNPQVNGFGFSISKIQVNGIIVPVELGTSALEIDFNQLGTLLGANVHILIEHHDGFKPKILNPEVLLPRSSFVVKDMKIEGNELMWSTTGEHGKLPFLIEEFRWNRWVKIGETEGKGQLEMNTYHVAIVTHSGENRIRVTQIDFGGMKRSSHVLSFVSDIPVVEQVPTKVKDVIHFKAKGTTVSTKFEIYDAYGNLVTEGTGSEINCSHLEDGVYYLNFDNTTEKFIKH